MAEFADIAAVAVGYPEKCPHLFRLIGEVVEKVGATYFLGALAPDVLVTVMQSKNKKTDVKVFYSCNQKK